MYDVVSLKYALVVVEFVSEDIVVESTLSLMSFSSMYM